MEMAPRLSHHTDWLLIPLSVIFILLIIARLYDRKRLKAIFFLPFYADRKQIEASFNPEINRGVVDLCLNFCSHLSLALGVFLVIEGGFENAPFLSDWQLYLRIVFIMTLFFVIKNLVVLIIAWIFGRMENAYQAQSTNLIYRSWLGLWLLPIGILLIFLPAVSMVFGYLLFTVLILGAFVAEQFTALKIWEVRIRAYYKILYLCTLEITPLIFLIVWLKKLAL